MHNMFLKKGYLQFVMQVDVSATVAYLMAPKDDSEIVLMKKASQLTVDVYAKYLKDQIMEIIDADKVKYIYI